MSFFQKRKITNLKYNEVIRALTSLGYEMSKKTATSHEKWICFHQERKYVVTVDKHEAPFSIFLIESMARQAGLDKFKFYELCKGNITAEECFPHISQP